MISFNSIHFLILIYTLTRSGKSYFLFVICRELETWFEFLPANLRKKLEKT